MVSQEQLSLIETLDKGGLTQKEIALLLGLTQTTVAKYRKRLGLVKSPKMHNHIVRVKAKNADRNQDMERLYMEGQTLQQIGEKYELTRERVRQILRVMGCGPRKTNSLTKVKVRKSRPIPSDRFWAKVNKKAPDGCWMWTGSAAGPGGRYGHIWWRGHHRSVRQISYFLKYRKWSSAEVLSNTCRKDRCVNPDHFIEGSRTEIFSLQSPIYRRNKLIAEQRRIHDDNV